LSFLYSYESLEVEDFFFAVDLHGPLHGVGAASWLPVTPSSNQQTGDGEQLASASIGAGRLSNLVGKPEHSQ
jgi:hypothetical protein